MREQRQKRKKWKAATTKYRSTHKQKSLNQATISQTISDDIDNPQIGNLISPSPSQSVFSSTSSFESPKVLQDLNLAEKEFAETDLPCIEK
ncbi:hypothetical protein AVEN_262585-1 [Araneus ventricosus]|uniref:Uncharacterized protein n=1 Tax=Araneus ventricosus TaxID=182803 RepID=A0A4Y2HJ84_ARAVE|nr:hypothetical protein AVEN_262585-1 [Araneus ventricosus]